MANLAFVELSKADQAYALDKVLKLTTAKKAVAFVIKEHAKDGCYWSYHVLDKLGDCIVVRYRGVPIRLLYKRLVAEFCIDELAPVSDMPRADPDDAWVYLDLTGNSARQQHAPTLTRMNELEQQVVALKKRIAAQDDVIIESERNAYTKAVAEMRKEDEAVGALLAKVEEKQAKIPKWVISLMKRMERGVTVQENPALYGIAMRVSHKLGFDWIDPRTGQTYKPPAPEKVVVTPVDAEGMPVGKSTEVVISQGRQRRLKLKGGNHEGKPKARKGKAKGSARNRKDSGQRGRKAVE
jgi:hypothetical protein